MNKDISQFTKFTAMLGRAQEEGTVWSSPNPLVDPSFAHLSGLCERVKTRSNEFAYIADAPDRDVWKTPKEFVDDSGGDCEDHAIYCYNRMVTWGVPEELVYLCVGELKGRGVIHAVTCVRVNLGVVNVLDCMQTQTTVMEWAERYFKPIYYINRRGWLEA